MSCKLIREGNAFYEIDEICMNKKKTKKELYSKEKETKDANRKERKNR